MDPLVQESQFPKPGSKNLILEFGDCKNGIIGLKSDDGTGFIRYSLQFSTSAHEVCPVRISEHKPCRPCVLLPSDL